jgi:hypothetical protein
MRKRRTVRDPAIWGTALWRAVAVTSPCSHVRGLRSRRERLPIRRVTPPVGQDAPLADVGGGHLPDQIAIPVSEIEGEDLVSRRHDDAELHVCVVWKELGEGNDLGI